ncbi:MAG: cbb3-type cytochrome oxidase assembly protein CcoS [Candidatus Kapabacteria bacterium]|jgi:cbb3-type cytochrome oxidase maturation protein|nr:cbb3-type cytochrome oxidase assembly protein CcoS [Candidatus Kapabacteria bacterium]
MSVVIILMSASLFVAIIFLVSFLWAVKNEQFDDTYTPSLRILNDDNNNNVKLKDGVGE